MTDLTTKTRNNNLKTLRPPKHKQLEFFIADEVEIDSFRDEMASMEHPFFALKSGDTKTRIYKNGNITVIIESPSSGMATIFDKDVWIYAISKLQEFMNKGEPISRVIAFTPIIFLLQQTEIMEGKIMNYLKKRYQD